MIPISKQEEDEIDRIDNHILTFTRGNRDFSVTMKDIYCYGEVDFNDDDTLDQIDEFKFLSHLGGVGIPIISRYDYETHSCSSHLKRPLWTETWSPADLARITHGYLGKPKRILLFYKNIVL